MAWPGAAAALALSSPCAHAEPRESHPEVLIVVNGRSPISVAIGAYYRRARGVPASNLLELDVPIPDPMLATKAHESIRRDRYRRSIRDPLERFLRRQDPGSRIEIIVLTKGIPLQVRGAAVGRGDLMRRDARASVDAELAVLSSGLEGSAGIAHAVNPYYGSSRPFGEWRTAHPDAPLRYLVARLTGYQTPLDPESGVPVDVKRLIDSATARAGAGSWLIDEDPGVSKGRAAANLLLHRPAAAILSALGLRVIHETTPAFARDVDAIAGFSTWGSNASRTPGAPFYGELDGARYPGRFLSRSIAVPFVSTNARSFVEPGHYGQSLAADLIRLGASGVAAHVREPGLPAVPRPHLLLGHYARGARAVEAFYRSIPYLSWMHVYVGDPLMEAPRPSRAEPDDLDGDRVADGIDNCLLQPNPGQRDTDADGYGNLCDPDVDNDGRVTTSWGGPFPGDLERIAATAEAGSYDADHDLDGDGAVDADDLSMAQLFLFLRPGPRGPNSPRRRP